MEQELVATTNLTTRNEERFDHVYDYQEAPPFHRNPSFFPSLRRSQWTTRAPRPISAMAVLLCALWLLVYNSSSSSSEPVEGESFLPSLYEQQSDNGPPKKTTTCAQICQAHRDSHLKRFGGDLLNTREMLRLAAAAKARMIARLKVDYGKQHFANIFEQEGATEDARKFLATLLGKSDQQSSTTRTTFPYRGVEEARRDGKSTNRFLRKLLLKLLAVQGAIRNEEGNIQGCDCIHGDIPVEGAGGAPTNENEQNPNRLYTQFVWATGGQSDAAGYGNLYNETYTAFLERAVKDVFGSVGIGFEGRNFGMDGTSSGYEVSMCSEAIFGSDIDVLSWDYAMADSGTGNTLFHYGYRAGLNPGRPALVGLHLNGRSYNPRLSMRQQLQAMGLAVFLTSTDEEAKMRDAIPDMEGLSEEQIQAFPPFVRNFKCSGTVERGEPHCSDEKYNLALCPFREGMTSWHYGWKSHAVEGNKLALFLVEILLNALNYLTNHADHVNPEETIEKLMKVEEDIVYEEFRSFPLPFDAVDLCEADPDSDLDVELLFRGPNICHTARLPAQIRYLGILTETDKLGKAAPVGDETYDVGIPRIEAADSHSKGVLRLVHEPGDRHKCPVPLKVDYADYFYAHGKDGWTKIVLPNDAEREAYQDDSTRFKGLIVVYFSDCYREKCDQGDLHGDNFGEGKYEIQVNGNAVTSWARIGGITVKASGYVMKGDGGIYWKPNSNGVYEVKVRVLDPQSFVRFSSFVLY